MHSYIVHIGNSSTTDSVGGRLLFHPLANHKGVYPVPCKVRSGGALVAVFMCFCLVLHIGSDQVDKVSHNVNNSPLG